MRLFICKVPCTDCRRNTEWMIYLYNPMGEMENDDSFAVQGWCLSVDCDCRFDMTITADEFAVFMNSQL